MDQPARHFDQWQERYRALCARQAAQAAQAQEVSARLDAACSGLLEELRKRLGLPPEG
jgi:hypothetical protein